MAMTTSAGPEENSRAGTGIAASAEPAVAVTGVSFAYTPGDPVLRDVSLNLAQGGFLAVIGPNGGGKTTLLRLLLGLERPQRGEVNVFGRPPAAVSRHVGYVPQFSTMQLDFPATVLEMTLMGGGCSSWRGGSWDTGREAGKKASAYLDILGLGDCADRPVGALSGGQRQRALVARALMGCPVPLDEPESAGAPAPFLLLLDEPTASVDPEGRFCFYEFLGRLRGRVSIIVVSHDVLMVSPFFSTIAFVDTTLTFLRGNELSAENLSILYGRHLHDCPVGDWQHAGGLQHVSGCTHPACCRPDDEKACGE